MDPYTSQNESGGSLNDGLESEMAEADAVPVGTDVNQFETFSDRPMFEFPGDAMGQSFVRRAYG